jgi:hypothetical protein
VKHARKRGSNPRLGRSVSAGGADDNSRQTGGGFFVGRRGPGGGGTLATEATKHGYNRVRVPHSTVKPRCSLPLSPDCMRLEVTAEWATHCFYPTYQRLRAVYGDDFYAIYDDLIQKELPTCSLKGVATGAEHELLRRVALATALLMNREGVPVRYPPDAITPRPARADHITQPWLRALLTGWI